MSTFWVLYVHLTSADMMALSGIGLLRSGLAASGRFSGTSKTLHDVAASLAEIQPKPGRHSLFHQGPKGFLALRFKAPG